MEPFYQAITDFIFVEDEPARADVIFVPGGHYPDTAIRAAGLYHDGYAPLILPSGLYAKAKGYFDGPEGSEWQYLHDILIREGVPEDAVLREDEATFTWENAIRSRQVLEQRQIPVRTALLCCQAYHARRCLMYYQEQFPDLEIRTIPVVTHSTSRENWFMNSQSTGLVLGEVRRIGEQFHCVLPLGHPDGYTAP